MKYKISKITSPTILFVLLLGCVSSPSLPRDLIIGRWTYLRADRLGDYSQNDSNSITEFNKGRRGAELIFNKEGTFSTDGPEDSRLFPFIKGIYSISKNGDSLALRKGEDLKIVLTDSTLKMTTPNNAIIIWKKISQ